MRIAIPYRIWSKAGANPNREIPGVMLMPPTRDEDEMTSDLTQDDAQEWTDADFARSEIRVGGKVVRPMTNELTLREKLQEIISRQKTSKFDVESDMRDFCNALEDTGSPAHMRVAAELRGE